MGPRSKQLTLGLPGQEEPAEREIAPGAKLMRGFALGSERALLDAVTRIVSVAPLRNMRTPGGFTMSVAMTNCGSAGWVTDETGYRYAARDPLTGEPWPAMPALFATLAQDAAARAGFAGFAPNACLVNRYAPGARMALHQDRNERTFDAPVVSVSLGLSATFLFGGLARNDRAERIELEHGDVIVWGGPSRLRYHGVLALKDGDHPLVGRQRVNLTFRAA